MTATMAEQGRGKGRSALRRFFLMEDQIAAAQARVGGGGEPGTAEARLALGAMEAAEALASRKVRLEYSDGSAAAFGLVREAAWWTLRAHLCKQTPQGALSDVPGELWDSAVSGTAHQYVAVLDPAVVERARAAFTARGWEMSAAAQDVRLGELKALREVVIRLLDPLEAGMARLTRLRIMRAARILTVVFTVATMVVSSTLAWKAHKRGPNLALHKQTTASSVFSGYETSAGAVDGNTSDIGFHTTQQDRPWLVIDLGQPTTFRQVVVYNREDCCRDRAVPLKVEVSTDGKDYREIARKDFEFSKWRALFPPVEARYVRFTAEKKTWLHFNEVEIYPGE